ncbi:MAG: tetratricopeptide repeat protein [Candidatus Poribacteria bacterium]|nr:tetratricopeptide repeat protein [Candidatus Poribacteria bacterium]
MLNSNRLASIAILVCLILSGCAVSRDTNRIEAYNQFAIKAAQAQLWNEAVFRWKQVIDVDPEDSKAYNNIGVAYEALGKIDEAVAAYQRATELEPDNKYYRLNYRRCRIHIRRSGIDDADTPHSEEEESSIGE